MKTTRRHLRRAARAFSLVELIVAVTIMAILAAVVVPKVTQYIGLAKTTTAKTDAETISNQVRMYMTTQGLSSLPGDFDLVQLTEGDAAVLTKNQLKDPWGNLFVIRIPPQKNADFDIISYGADGKPGGSGDDEDIVKP